MTYNITLISNDSFKNDHLGHGRFSVNKWIYRNETSTILRYKGYLRQILRTRTFEGTFEVPGQLRCVENAWEMRGRGREPEYERRRCVKLK